MNFDEIIERRGSHSAKWDGMENYAGVSPEDGIPMWVADMDFRPPACVTDALRAYLDHGVFGYFGDDSDYLSAIRWWQKTRHGWEIEDSASIFSTHGLVNGVSMCVHTWSHPGDAVVLFTPVYHAFHRVLAAAGREITQLPLIEENGRYGMDFAAYDGLMSGREKLLILCSPHNPGGRCWTREELRGIADFAERHGLIVVSDEIHADLVLPGAKHIPFPVAAPEARPRTVMLTAGTKTFNLAGIHTGNVTVEDPALREAFEASMMAMGISPNAFGKHAMAAAFSPAGAEWVDALTAYLDGNRQVFDAGIAEIPGMRSMPLEATYLAWVDFSGTGMEREEVMRRIAGDARIAVNQGPAFGLGGDTWNRFNFATPRARVVEAVERLQKAFADLQ